MMTTNESDKKQWTDPKDFGLPWVEIKPLKVKPKPAESSSIGLEEAKPGPIPIPVQSETTFDESTQKAEIEVDKESSSQVSQNNVPSIQYGTTIAQSISGNLIRVESQAERPQYFIIVGSVPSEADALKLIPDFQAKVPEVYLISPYSESKNYRVAIRKFTSFRAAAEELDKIKSQYSEELWILKY